MNAQHTRSLWLSLALILTASFACQRDQAHADPYLTIAAAADLRFAMEDLISEFERQRPSDSPPVEIRVTYGSSGNFFAQLSQRAPFDLYFSADIAYPARLASAGLALDDDIFEYAIGRLVIWVPETSPLDVESLRWDTLTADGVRRIAIANPAHAPYGEAAVAAMRTASIFEEVEPRLVLGENIAQAAQFVDSGAADVGIIALALAIAPSMATRGRYWEIPFDTFPTMRQGAMITGWTAQPDLAREFRAFLLGPEGQSILRRYGFYLPGDTS
jgi:molybdate transport system substrate-binding protein